MFIQNSVMFPALLDFLLKLEQSQPEAKMHFLLDPLAIPEVLNILDILGQQAFDHIMYLTRTYAYYIYRQKQILLGFWKSDNFKIKKIKKQANENSHNNGNTNLSLISGQPVADDIVHSFPPPGVSTPAQLMHAAQDSLHGAGADHPDAGLLVLHGAGALQDGVSGHRGCREEEACQGCESKS